MTDPAPYPILEQVCRACGLHTRPGGAELWVAVRTFVSQLERHGYEIKKIETRPENYDCHCPCIHCSNQAHWMCGRCQDR